MQFIFTNSYLIAFYLLLVLQLSRSSFSNYQDAILSSGVFIAEKTIDMINQDDEDTYGIGFWSMSIPLQIPKKNIDFDVPFNQALKEQGELLLLVKDSDTNDNLIIVSKILDYQNLQVQHRIGFMNNDSNYNIILNFNGLDYEGQWIFHLILIQPKKGTIIVQVNEQRQLQIFNAQAQQNLKIILGGRGYINNENLDSFRGLLSNLIFLPNFQYLESSSQQIMNDNQVPQKYLTEQQFYIIPEFQIFNGYQTLQYAIDQYGKRYCLSGWVKYNFDNVNEGKFVLLRITSFQNYEDEKKLGDKLFYFEVFFSKINPQKTKINVHSDAYSMPVQQSFQSQYDLTFQGIQNHNYQIIQSTKILENQEDYRYYEGLQQWHFIQYEYGRSNNEERMQLSIQFYNELGLLKEQLGNDLFGSSFINYRFNVFFGGDNFNENFLQAEVSDFKFSYNYDYDKELDLNCHYSCLTCKGPLNNNCIDCDQNSNRYYQSEVSMCLCNQGYFDQGTRICNDQFYSSIQLQEVSFRNQNICPLGYFRLPINDDIYECKECPQQITSSSFISCVDCYFYYKIWYQRPVCKLDLVTIKDTKNSAFHQIARNAKEYELYSIGSDRELIMRLGFEDYCFQNPFTINKCYKTPYQHLGSDSYMKCKPNYFIEIISHICLKYQTDCPIYNSLGKCDGCYPGKYFVWPHKCLNCPIGCAICQAGFKGIPICTTCSKYYSFLDNQCQKCGEFCEICEKSYDDNIGQEYLRCLKCINESRYILSLNGKQCLFNQIPNCVYAFQALQDDFTINSLDIKFQPQYDDSKIVSICAKCITSFVFVFEFNQCVKDDNNQDCSTGIGQLNQNDTSLKSIICLSSSQYVNQVVQFTEKCSIYNNNCLICLQTDLIDSFACIDCIQGYYLSIQSGKCLECPQVLRCKTCYSQHSLLKDRWRIEVRAFYREYIEKNDFHQYIVYGQSQNPIDYEIICSSCINGYRFHNNECIQYCSNTCIECIFLDNKYLCNKCQYEQKGRKLTLINNECIECPENCSLCRIRTNDEIQQINPVFNNINYIKYTYQCLLNYEDSNYYYDEDFGLFIECNPNIQGNACYKQLIISLNLYSDYDEYDQDFSILEDEQSKINFPKENIILQDLVSYTTSFVEFENDEFYQMANSKLIKSIIIKISSKSEIVDYIYYGGYIKQIFSENIFTLNNVEIEFNFEYETIIYPLYNLEFINFSKITINGIQFQVFDDTRFIFSSYFQQTIILNSINFLLYSNIDTRTVNFQFAFNNLSSLIVNNMLIQNISLISQGGFLIVEETNFTKSIVLKNFTIQQCDIQTNILQLGLGNQDRVQIDDLNINSTFTNSTLITLSQKNENGWIKLSNIVFTGKIFGASQFFNFQQAEYLEIINFQIIQTELTNTAFIILNRNSYIENIKFINNQFLKQSFGILNYNSQLNFNITQQFKDVLIQDNQYDSYMQFINLKKYSSQTQNITINFLNIINNYFVGDTINQYMKQVDFSLLSIQYDYINLFNLFIQRGFGQNDISFSECQRIIIQNGTIKQEKYRFLGLHLHLNCQLKQVYAQYYSTTLKVSSSKLTEMKNLTFFEIQSYNFPIIAIDSADQSKMNQNEDINLQDITFNSSLVLFTEAIFQTSLISILSSQQGLIKITNIKFLNNVMHQYIQSDLTKTAGLLLLICPLCQIDLIDSFFTKNFVLNSSESIIYIKSQTIQISDSIFQNNSIFMYDIIQPHLLWGFTTSIPLSVIRSIFKSKSNSGVAEIQAQTILLQNNTLTNSTGSIGGSFSIFAYSNAKIDILNNKFEGIQTQFFKEMEYGGVIYIDASSSASLKIDIKDNLGKRIFCRGLGGFLYLKSNTSQSNLTIQNLNLQNTYAQQGSVIYVSYSKLVQQPQSLYVKNLIVANTEIGYQEFLAKFNEFSSQQEIQYLINNRSLIYLQQGSLVQISNVQIMSLILESFSVFYEIKSVYLSHIEILNSSISNNLISISSFTSTNQQINFQHIVFRYIDLKFNFANQVNLSCIDINSSSSNIPYQCLNQILNAPLILQDQYLVQQQRAFCVFQEIIQYIDQSNSGIILFNNFTNLDTIQMSSISLINIQCSICQNGLISLQFYFQETQIQKQLLTSLLVQNSVCGKQGCLNFKKNSQQNNRFLNEFQIYSLTYELEIREYVCQNNIATQGTCLNINSLLTLMQNSRFQHNEAYQEGGAIYVKGNKYLIIENSIVQFNKALIGGGMYMLEQVSINQQNSQTKIIKNSAKIYGDDVASIPQQLSLQLKSDYLVLQTIDTVNNKTVKIQEVVVQPYIGINGKIMKYIYLPTGQAISTYQVFDWKNKIYQKPNLIFRIVALDGDQNIIQNLNNSQCYIESRKLNLSNFEDQEFTNNYTNIQLVNFNQVTQSYNLDDMIIYFDNSSPDDIVLQLQFYCSSIKIPINNIQYPFEIIDYHSNYKLQVNIKTFDCQLGEIKNTTSLSCIKCDHAQGLYSLTLNSQRCDIKDELTTLNIQDNQLILRAGYWRPYFDTKEISHCINLQDNCLGGIQEGDSSCYIGHIGALCEQCDIFNLRGDGQFSMVNKFQCGPCVQKERNILIVLVIIISTLIFLLISVQGNIAAIEQYTKQLPFKILRNSILMNKNQSGILIKMLTNYFQIIVSITTFQIQFSTGLNNTLNIVGNPLQTSTYSLDCFLIDLNDIQIEYTRMIWQVILPLLYIAVFICSYLLLKKLREENLNSSVATTTSIYIYIYFQPNLVKGFIELLSYRNISGFKWIQANVSQRYDTISHTMWMLQFCLPLIIFISIIIPCYFFFGLYTNKNNLEKRNTRLNWGYLYNEYKVEAYFWELVKIVQKELIIFSLVYYEDTVVIKGVLVLFITYIYQELNLKYQPYKLINLNKLDYYSANISMITIGLAIGAFMSQSAKIEELRIPLYFIMLLLNLQFLYSIIAKLITEYSKEYELFLEKIKESLRKRIPVTQRYAFLQRLLKNRIEERKKAILSFQKLRKLSMPLAKRILLMRQSFNQDNSKMKSSANPFHFFILKSESSDQEKSTLNRMLKINS